jgi:L-alanine-DL-glutamate epimerase-like enolase superfamily enzyme
MKIVKIEDIHVDGGWDVWSFLKITTDDGLVGWSEFSEERARRGLTMVIRSLASQLIGEDPRAFGRIGAKLFNATIGCAGGLQTLATGAFENACLDIAGKALGVPVYALFGGPLRKRLPLYWSHFGMYRAKCPDIFEKLIGEAPIRNLDDLKRAGAMVAQRGYKALKTNRMVFDPQRLNGGPPQVGRGSGAFERSIEPWIVNEIVDQLEALRDGAGPGVALMMDLNFNYKVEGFRRIAKAVEKFDMQWLEMDSLDPQALADVRQSTSTPIASLETILGRRALRPFAEQKAVDVPIVDVIFNGFLESFRMAALLDSYDLNVAAHNTFSHLGTAISAHFCAVVPNFRVLEFDVDEVPWRRDLVTRPLSIEAGELVLNDGPGWGMDINEEVAKAHAVRTDW